MRGAGKTMDWHSPSWSEARGAWLGFKNHLTMESHSPQLQLSHPSIPHVPTYLFGRYS